MASGTLGVIAKRPVANVAWPHATRPADQTGAFEPEAFAAGLADSLSQGRFRLVLVLHAAPAELIRLVGDLGVISEQLVIDLITVTS